MLVLHLAFHFMCVCEVHGHHNSIFEQNYVFFQVRHWPRHGGVTVVMCSVTANLESEEVPRVDRAGSAGNLFLMLGIPHKEDAFTFEFHM